MVAYNGTKWIVVKFLGGLVVTEKPYHVCTFEMPYNLQLHMYTVDHIGIGYFIGFDIVWNIS